jgi:mono/diheme cytochrome c family protein
MQADVSEDSGPSAQDHGQDVYMHSCVGCHGIDGTDVKGFNLHSANLHMTAEQLMSWIRNPAPPMPKIFPEPLDAVDTQDLKDLAAFLAQW